MSIVTRTGDNGETGLVGGSRIPKSDVRLHAYGTVDELNAALGMALASTPLLPKGEGGRGKGGRGEGEQITKQLISLQHLLFRLGADLASPMHVKKTKRIEPMHTTEVEGWIEALEKKLPPLTSFILPGGSKAGGALHLARTICRRAERWTVALAEFEEVNKEAIVFLNRLGDYLFLAARGTNHDATIKEEGVEY
ncbi:MAG: cob(I)yrinic acid a,c-diamide adenosyltransferase [Candidatus Peribacteraceae bacterium]|jgi:cob(I)alamin adenosyltransferase